MEVEDQVSSARDREGSVQVRTLLVRVVSLYREEIFSPFLLEHSIQLLFVYFEVDRRLSNDQANFAVVPVTPGYCCLFGSCLVS